MSRKANAQMDFFYEKIVDNFAGSGGASVGIEMATGRPVDVAINHDPDAILLHKTNHPHTVHYQEDVFTIDPYEVAGGHPIGLAWFSPTCTHFSKAKGSPLVDRHIRGLAWVTLRWAMTVRPRGIMLENVEEFQTWGPLMPNPKGVGYVPDPARAGETFRAFVQMLTTGCKEKNDAFYEACEFLQLDPDGADAKRLLDGLGYDLEYRELVAADYGAHKLGDIRSERRFLCLSNGNERCGQCVLDGYAGSRQHLLYGNVCGGKRIKGCYPAGRHEGTGNLRRAGKRCGGVSV